MVLASIRTCAAFGSEFTARRIQPLSHSTIFLNKFFCLLHFAEQFCFQNSADCCSVFLVIRARTVRTIIKLSIVCFHCCVPIYVVCSYCILFSSTCQHLNCNCLLLPFSSRTISCPHTWDSNPTYLHNRQTFYKQQTAFGTA